MEWVKFDVFVEAQYMNSIIKLLSYVGWFINVRSEVPTKIR